MRRPAERMTVAELAGILAGAPPDAVVVLGPGLVECPDCWPLECGDTEPYEVAGVEYARGVLLIDPSPRQWGVES